LQRASNPIHRSSLDFKERDPLFKLPCFIDSPIVPGEEFQADQQRVADVLEVVLGEDARAVGQPTEKVHRENGGDEDHDEEQQAHVEHGGESAHERVHQRAQPASALDNLEEAAQPEDLGCASTGWVMIAD
jgi:hypothetical protein